MPTFAKNMGEGDQSLGYLVNTAVMNNSHSKIFKSVIMYFFYKDYDVTKEYYKIISSQDDKMADYFSKSYGIEQPNNDDKNYLTKTFWAVLKVDAIQY